MNLNQIKLLLELKHHEFNLSAASQALNIVQSAGTRQLKLLEDELALRVFERKGKRLTGFTPEGLMIFEQAKQICLAQKNIKAIADDFQHANNGKIFLACTHTQAKYFLPHKLISFKRMFPGVKIHIEQGTPKQLVKWLLDGHVDIAISTEALDEYDQFKLEPCYEWNHVLVTPTNHLLTQQKLKLEGIAQFPILTYMPGMTGQTKILNAFLGKDIEIEIDLFATDSDVIKNYVRLGFGVGIIAEIAFNQDQEKGLVAQSLAPWIEKSCTKVGYLRHRYFPEYTKQFIELLKKGEPLQV